MVLSLSNELLCNILSNLIEDKKTLCAVARVCPRLRDIAQDILFREAHLDVNSKRYSQFYLALQQRPQLHSRVHRLQIALPEEVDSSRVKKHINNLLDNLSGLRDFSFVGQPYNPFYEPKYFRPAFLKSKDFPVLRTIQWRFQICPEMLGHFMLLPSIQKIYLQGLRSDSDQEALYEQFEEKMHQSPLTELHVFSTQPLPFKAFQSLLSLPKSLSLLHINESGGRQVSGDSIPSLLHAVRDTLRELYIFNRTVSITPPSTPANLSGFLNLRRLWMPFRHLNTPLGPTEGPIQHNLAHLLPACLMELKMFYVSGDNAVILKKGHPTKAQMNDCLISLAEGKARSFPQLVLVILEEQDSGVESAQWVAPRPMQWIPILDLMRDFKASLIRFRLIAGVLHYKTNPLPSDRL
ncbi:hypothetical protein EJ04DRAFT_562268 [Polyplosphaeria fusca]|uniref:F-box domain-containing protein n=1 Tax=Polyplosphaeria fusca TaxID=682080 RepID=A0A9P4R4K4_9PLEO|nr:hypothetical protein EJ04DRAFT_562268 [Polyplosphaeria fusca]